MDVKSCNEDGNPTLGECTGLLFDILGSYCEENGFETKTRNDYISEKNLHSYSKYNISNHSSDLYKLLDSFYKTICKYQAYSKEAEEIVLFPVFLYKMIANFQNSKLFSRKKSENILISISYKIAYFYCTRGCTEELEKIIKDRIDTLLTDSYKRIKKLYSEADNEIELSEKCKWSTIKNYLDRITEHYKSEIITEKTRMEISSRLIKHYLFLNFCNGLENNFGITANQLKDFLENTAENLNNLAYNLQKANQNNQILYSEHPELEEELSDTIVFSCVPFVNVPADNVFYKDYISPQMMELYSQDRTKISDKDIQFLKDYFALDDKINAFKNDIFKISAYCLQNCCQFNKKTTKDCLQIIQSYGTSEGIRLYYNWFKARSLIFSLQFDNSQEEKAAIEEARTLFKITFDECKYFLGKNAAEFLSDAIASEVYFNKKQLKDILDNTQDNSNESSVSIQASAYWEFGYALNIFDVNSKKTYLLNYNAEENFWTNFPLFKFTWRENATKVYSKEIINNEIELPSIIANQNSKLDAINKRILINGRAYTKLSCAIMNMQTDQDIDAVSEYIKEADNSKLAKNDENGATPLLRAINLYKSYKAGNSKDFSAQKYSLFSDFENKRQIDSYSQIKKSDSNLLFSDSRLQEKINTKISQFYRETLEKYLSLVNENLKNGSDFTELQKKADIIKEKIIKPLILKTKDHLFDEAIQLDFHYCVTALQLAIDCFDFELVQLIVEAFPDGKQNLAKIYISEEFVTPLQYAIRKYDLLMQFRELRREKQFALLEFRELPCRRYVSKGLLYQDKLVYNEFKAGSFLKSIPTEQIAQYITTLSEAEQKTNIVCKEQKELIEIIKYLAGRTKPVSVDNFYYLADQMDDDNSYYDDVFMLARHLIDTGNADLGGTDFEYKRFDVPNQTLLAYCIVKKYYGFLNLLLGEYPESFKDIINKKIMAYGDIGESYGIRYDTDLHLFITNEIESAKLYQKMTDKNQKESYGLQIAHTTNYFLKLFYKAGAKFNIPDQDNKTALDYLREWKDYFPKDSYPDEVLGMLG